MTLNVNLKAFGIIANWMYTQDIVASSGEPPDLCTLAQVWILGDRFLMPKLQNQAMTDLINLSLSGKSTSKEIMDCCHIADDHAAGESRLTLIAVLFAQLRL